MIKMPMIILSSLNTKEPCGKVHGVNVGSVHASRHEEDRDSGGVRNYAIGFMKLDIFIPNKYRLNIFMPSSYK
jgi:hypothetical protein